MKLIADYHTHTKYSHGKGTIEENVLVAISKGLKTVGISDHGYKHLTYGIKEKSIYLMREEIDRLKEKYDNIEILLGVECNILDEYGNIDINDKMREVCDYVMAGYHFASTPSSLKSLFNHFDNYVLKREKAKHYNTKAVINAMEKNDIFILTHPGDKGDIFIEDVAKIAKKTDTRLEINNSHNFLNKNQINEIKHIGNKFVIGSDAHIPSDVGNFESAMKTIKESNLNLELVENIK
jgi:putative hydrolase